MGALAKTKVPEISSGGESSLTPKQSNVGSTATRSGWNNFNILGGGDPAERARKKSIAEEERAQDDRHIRFTIHGVGQRLTKDDFIKTMQGLDSTTRTEVIDKSTASHVVKTLAKQDAPRRGGSPSSQIAPDEEARSTRTSSRVSRSRSPSISPGARPGRSGKLRADDGDEPETAAERRRRLAVLSSQGDGEDLGETPAEKRRREAALGMTEDAVEEDSEEDDEGTERVPPTGRRGIRFADVPERGRE